MATACNGICMVWYGFVQARAVARAEVGPRQDKDTVKDKAEQFSTIEHLSKHSRYIKPSSTIKLVSYRYRYQSMSILILVPNISRRTFNDT